MTKLPEATRGRRFQFFDAPETDQMMSMLLGALSELSVTRERLFAIEKLAVEKGLFSIEELESVQFTPDEETELEESLNRMLKEVFYPLQFNYRKAVPRKSPPSGRDSSANLGNAANDLKEVKAG